MNENDLVRLPGLNMQLSIFRNSTKLSGMSVLVIGASSEIAAARIAEETDCTVEVIVEDYESLINSQLNVKDKDKDKGKVKIRNMDFESTDFGKDVFDAVYAQASISSERRAKIIKEIKRILKPRGVFCAGEITTLEKNVPRFVSDIFEQSDLKPIFCDEISEYYSKANFDVISLDDLSNTLKDFYKNSLSQLEEGTGHLSDQEKKYHKKMLKQIGHEAKAYLKGGADEFIGFHVLMLRKKEN